MSTANDVPLLTCPSCKRRLADAAQAWPSLHPHVDANGLPCQRCEQCHGMLVDIGQYATWVTAQRPESPPPSGAPHSPAPDSDWSNLPQSVLNPPASPLGAWAPWIEAPPPPAPTADPKPTAASRDSIHALVCPCCDRLMLRYRVTTPAMGLDFCFACSLVWLDDGEWEQLAQHGLHLRLPQISTAYWQRAQQRQQLQAQREAHLRQLLGEAGFKQTLAIHRWLLRQPERAAILRFLQSDPAIDESEGF